MYSQCSASIVEQTYTSGVMTISKGVLKQVNEMSLFLSKFTKMGYSMKELQISDTPCMDYCHLVGFCGHLMAFLHLLLAPLTASCVNRPAYPTPWTHAAVVLQHKVPPTV